MVLPCLSANGSFAAWPQMRVNASGGRRHEPRPRLVNGAGNNRKDICLRVRRRRAAASAAVALCATGRKIGRMTMSSLMQLWTAAARGCLPQPMRTRSSMHVR